MQYVLIPIGRTMSVRHALLGLLSEGPKYGMQLREEYEGATGDMWPLNVGQVYTTLQRLERDGLVESDDANDEERQKDYRITDRGRSELLAWLTTPPAPAPPARDELVTKVLVALRVPEIDVQDVIQAHRRQVVALMQQWTSFKRGDEPDLAFRLTAEAELSRLGAVVKWLDFADQEVNAPRGPRARPRAPVATPSGGPAVSLLELRDISKSYGEGATEVHALVDIDLFVDGGQLVAVMGPSGSGKSTLLTIAGSLEEPTSGDVRISRTSLSSLSRNDKARLRRRTIGYVFQDFNLLPGLTAAENVALPLELDGIPARKARAVGIAALERLGLADRADRCPDQLSGGERQRVAIARAVVGERHLLLADEPSGALDSTNVEAVMAMIRDACQRGVAAVVVTHDAHLASWADRVVFLRDGHIVDHVAPDAPDSLSALPSGNGVARHATLKEPR